MSLKREWLEVEIAGIAFTSWRRPAVDMASGGFRFMLAPTAQDGRFPFHIAVHFSLFNVPAHQLDFHAKRLAALFCSIGRPELGHLKGQDEEEITANLQGIIGYRLMAQVQFSEPASPNGYTVLSFKAAE